jgi:hypothetical protein
VPAADAYVNNLDGGCAVLLESDAVNRDSGLRKDATRRIDALEARFQGRSCAAILLGNDGATGR